MVAFVTCFHLLSGTNFSVSHRPCPPSMYSGHNGIFMLNEIILSGLLQRMSRQLQCVIMLCKPWEHMHNHSAFLGNIGHMETNFKMLEVFRALFVFCVSGLC